MTRFATRCCFASLALALAAFAATAQTQAAPASGGDWHPPADTTTLELWPGGAPGPQTATEPEHDTTTVTDHEVAGQRVTRIGDVSDPTITLYRAAADRNSGAAVVVFPGGGYRILAIDLEGTEVCKWLNSIRVHCVLLKYRVPNSGPYPKSSAALQDAQRAVSMVREHAAQWGIDTHRIGVLGFSAGGHLAAAISTHDQKHLYDPVDGADQLSCRPDFAIVIYPGYLALADKNFEFNPDIPVTSKTPPTFLVQAEDDPVHVENAVEYFLALKRAGVPAELHVYAKGGHGYGLRRTDLPVTTWPVAAERWLRTIGVLPEPGQ
ncbi:MAG TPA: alpha/beta hydrolase [Acidobacteriaceae bacterium]|nr:alpha/beta hydrolase [Acidobacteriaceae bacterium]